ncbi:MAG: rod shape-determining protein MreD [Eubacteriales bacterium]|nr:rod shape-determining protein MreD [Eubacteriales bacterium]
MRGAIYTVLAIILCALQTTIFEHLSFFGTVPNLLIGLVVCVALTRSALEGGAIGLLCGIFIDVLGRGTFGVNALLFLYIGVALGLVSNKFYRIRGLVVFAFAFLSNFVYAFLMFFFKFYIWGYGNMLAALAKKIIPETIYTAVFSVLILFLIRSINKRVMGEEA